MNFKTRQQVAEELGISARTLTRLIRREQLPVKSGLLTPREQDLILDRLGFLQVEPDASTGIESANNWGHTGSTPNGGLRFSPVHLTR